MSGLASFRRFLYEGVIIALQCGIYGLSDEGRETPQRRDCNRLSGRGGVTSGRRNKLQA